MLSVPTTFVIGAGAGPDLNMPVGAELCQAIADRLNIYFEWGNEKRSGDVDVIKAIRTIAKESNGDPNDWYAAGRAIKNGIFQTGSIDDFCHAHHDNDKIRECAKLGIAKSILERERGSYLFVANPGHDRRFSYPEKVQSSWISAFFRVLSQEVVISNNPQDIFKNLTVINFNYDRCFEHYIYHALQNFLIPDKEAAELINENLEIYHPYGALGCLSWQNGYSKVDFGGADYYTPDYVTIARQIKTYDERMEDVAMLSNIRGALLKAERIVFLGCHFHKQNMTLLGGEEKKGPNCQVLATSKGRSESDIGIIKQRIWSALKTKSIDGRASWEKKNLDCGGMFAEFGTLLSA